MSSSPECNGQGHEAASGLGVARGEAKCWIRMDKPQAELRFLWKVMAFSLGSMTPGLHLQWLGCSVK